MHNKCKYILHTHTQSSVLKFGNAQVLDSVLGTADSGQESNPQPLGQKVESLQLRQLTFCSL